MIFVKCALCLLFLAGAQASGQALLVTAKNRLAAERHSETIAISLSDIRDALGNTDNLAVEQEGIPGARLVSQSTDTEFIFQSTFGPKETRSFRIFRANDRRVPAPSKVAGLFALPREDYAWENDHVAFRVYGPALAAEVNNGIDVWTKRVDYPIVAKWYKESESSQPGHDSYHVDKGEGADYFSVGRTLGAGGSGLWINGALVQPGVFRSQKTLAAGPVRVSFVLTYAWGIGNDTLTEEKTISLDAGQNFNRIEVRFRGAALPKDLDIACGLVTRGGVAATRGGDDGWIAMWGPTVADSLAGSLGTGLVVPPGSRCTYVTLPNQEIVVVPVSSGAPFVYYAGFGWTGRGDVAARHDWERMVRERGERLRSPLEVRISKIR